MHNLSEYIPYIGNEHKVDVGTHPVLAWNKKDGYYFTQFGFCLNCAEVVAILEV